MFKPEIQRLARKLFILVVMIAGLGVLSAAPGSKATNSPNDMKNKALPCCSVCDEHPEFCTHGCTCCFGVC